MNESTDLQIIERSESYDMQLIRDYDSSCRGHSDLSLGHDFHFDCLSTGNLLSEITEIQLAQDVMSRS
jgi:hypothetical protein